MGTSPSPEIGLLQPKLTLYFYIWILAIKELKIILYIAIYCTICIQAPGYIWLCHVKFSCHVVIMSLTYKGNRESTI